MNISVTLNISLKNKKNIFYNNFYKNQIYFFTINKLKNVKSIKQKVFYTGKITRSSIWL